MTNTVITIDVANEVIPAEVIARLRGMKETSQQAEKRHKKEYEEEVKNFEKEARMEINKSLLENGYAKITIDNWCKIKREDACGICEKLKKEFDKAGYMTGGWGKYADTNYYQWYELVVIV